MELFKAFVAELMLADLDILVGSAILFAFCFGMLALRLFGCLRIRRNVKVAG